jgi:transmembrane E3 ubiquitin-protein ligase
VYRVSELNARMLYTQPKRDYSFEPLLSHFKIFGPPIDSSRASYYPNITGFIHGDAVFHNITPSHISGHNPKPPWSDATESLMHGVNITKLAESIGTWDWSASRKLALSVVEKKPPPEQNALHDILLIRVAYRFFVLKNPW